MERNGLGKVRLGWVGFARLGCYGLRRSRMEMNWMFSMRGATQNWAKW